jgi:hypothetical protein
MDNGNGNTIRYHAIPTRILAAPIVNSSTNKDRLITAFSTGPCRDQTTPIVVRNGRILLFIDQIEHPRPQAQGARRSTSIQAPLTTGAHMGYGVWASGARTQPQPPAPSTYWGPVGLLGDDSRFFALLGSARQ